MDLEKIIIDEMRNQYKRKCELPEGKELLLYLHSMMLITGRSDIMYCNCFLAEATQLLINSIFLYEEGYFDCAFYSVRQASEVFNAMLYLSEDKDELKKWTTKERFPMDSKIRKKLEEMVWGYQEIKTILCDYFKHHRELINSCLLYTSFHILVHRTAADDQGVGAPQHIPAHINPGLVFHGNAVIQEQRKIQKRADRCV